MSRLIGPPAGRKASKPTVSSIPPRSQFPQRAGRGMVPLGVAEAHGGGPLGSTFRRTPGNGAHQLDNRLERPGECIDVLKTLVQARAEGKNHRAAASPG